MNTKAIIKVGLLAGLISALFPSIPTIVSFEYYKQAWFLIYTLLALLIILVVLKA